MAEEELEKQDWHEQNPHKRLAEPRKQSFALAFTTPNFYKVSPSTSYNTRLLQIEWTQT